MDIHYQRGTKTYNSWRGMLERCRFPEKYPNYADIKVCERWLRFVNFFEDMGERPEGMTLDRIDGSGNYSKENCRWATYSEQLHNKKYREVTDRGVHFHGNKWRAIISKDSKRIIIGSYETKSDALLAYKKASEEIYSGLNQQRGAKA